MYNNSLIHEWSNGEFDVSWGDCKIWFFYVRSIKYLGIKKAEVSQTLARKTFWELNNILTSGRWTCM